MTTQPIDALSIAASQGSTAYPDVFQAPVAGRLKRKLGDHFGLRNFGVNLTTLAPGSASALIHHHTLQDELVYILEGHATLILGDKTYEMAPGDCCGFPAGSGEGHQLSNQSEEPVLYIEIGDRAEGDSAAYPNDDLKAEQLADGQWKFTHKNGTDY